MKADGSDRRKISAERILDLLDVSPDGRWAAASSPNDNEENQASSKAFALDGSEIVPLCGDYCMLTWDLTGKSMYF